MIHTYIHTYIALYQGQSQDNRTVQLLEVDKSTVPCVRILNLDEVRHKPKTVYLRMEKLCSSSIFDVKKLLDLTANDCGLNEPSYLPCVAISPLIFASETLNECLITANVDEDTQPPPPYTLTWGFVEETGEISEINGCLTMSRLQDAKKSLNQLQEDDPTPGVSQVHDFMPISKDPGSRGVGHEKSNDAWTVEGVRQWHKMKGRGKSKEGKLSSHFASNSHKALLEALVAFQHKFQHINNIMDTEQMKICIEAEAKKQRNQEAIKILIDIARHGSESDANGNFHQLVLLVARHSPALRRWLDQAEKRPQRATYFNWNSQNEFLELLSDYVNEKVKSEVTKI
eukprot:Seg3558.1 transcript_id=Seg3558.1/GoldUCD/mRNA.D3Y31 product="hypothetical protein" protein_id=Seg3558.1/GoldUCD/D3Y31